MGMSSYVVGIKPPDDVWRRMKAAYEACEAAGVEIPDEVNRFFNDEAPDAAGVIEDLHGHPCVSKYAGDAAEGLEVDLKKLPPDITVLRFVNSW